jgi:hypothetical protein
MVFIYSIRKCRTQFESGLVDVVWYSLHESESIEDSSLSTRETGRRRNADDRDEELAGTESTSKSTALEATSRGSADGVLVLLVAASMAFACGGSSDDPTPPPEESDIWDKMNWDQGSWGLHRVSAADTLG